MTQPWPVFFRILRSPRRTIASLVLGSLLLSSCGGDDAAPPSGEAAPASTETTDITPLNEATDPVEELAAGNPATTAPAPTNPATGASVFTSDNFTITITGFGLDAAYKGCDTQGQCLEIPRASSHENGNYTWENQGYLYMMAGVVGGNYRLEVRDPQGKVLVDELVTAVHNSQSNTPDAP